MLFRTATIFLLGLAGFIAHGQETYLEYRIDPVGGNLQFEQVLETQLTLPPLILTRNFAAEIKVNFSIDSAGKASDLVIEGAKNNLLRKEITRIMNFYTFRRTTLPLTRAQPYVVVFNLSTRRYNKYLKQKSRAKISAPACDSSCIVYSRPAKLPEYYKGADAGLREYILSEMYYPPVARERSVEGTVVLEFVVETNGFITGIETRQSVGAGCTEEAIRILRKTRWKPAEYEGKAVRCKMEYPITFSLRGASGPDVYPSAVGN